MTDFMTEDNARDRLGIEADVALGTSANAGEVVADGGAGDTVCVVAGEGAGVVAGDGANASVVGTGGANDAPAAGESARSRARAAFDAWARARKEATVRASDRLAWVADDARENRHARGLYRHVLWLLAGAYQEWLCRERREGRADAEGLPERRFRVLDLGCGGGALTALVRDALPYARVTGIDLSGGMVDAARERLGGTVRLYRADAERLPFAESSFDAVLANDVFHHLPDGPRASFESWRVLARDGVLVLGDTWAPAPARGVLNQLVLPHSAGGDVCVRSEAELTGMVGAWFQEVSWKRVGLGSCLLVARKSPVDRR